MKPLISSRVGKYFILGIVFLFCMAQGAFAGDDFFDLMFSKTLAGACNTSANPFACAPTSGFENAPAQAVTISPVFTLPSGGGAKGGAVATDPTGNVFVGNGNTVLKVDARLKTISTVAGATGGSATSGYVDGAANAAQFTLITALGTDGSGNVYIADVGSSYNAIRMLNVVSNSVCTIATTSSSGTIQGCFGTPLVGPVYPPQAMTVNSAGTALYLADSVSNIYRLDQTGIHPVAGQGSAGYAGGSGNASAAQFNKPLGLTLDPAGNLYIADTGNCIIREIDTSPTPQISLIAGTAPISNVPQCGSADGAVGTGKLNYPTGIAYEPDGWDDQPDLVINDTGSNVFRSVDLAGTSVGVLNTRLSSPLIPTGASLYGVALGLNGGFAVDLNNNLVFELGESLNGGAVYMTAPLPSSSQLPTLPALPTLNSSTFTVYLTAKQDVYIKSITAPFTPKLNYPEFRIGQVSGCTIDSTGATLTPAGTVCAIPITFAPYRLKVRWAPLVVTYTAGQSAWGMTGFSMGSSLGLINAGMSTYANFGSYFSNGSLSGAVMDPGNNVFVTTGSNNGVYWFNNNGSWYVRLPWGFNNPSGVAEDPAGNLYVADTNNCQIVSLGLGSNGVNITLTPGFGGPNTSFGDGTCASTSTSTNYPKAILADTLGYIYFVDTGSGNDLIRVFSPKGNGTVSAYAGCTNNCDATDPTRDGIPATTAALGTVNHLAMDRWGNMYISVASSGGNSGKVRKIDVNGIITTVVPNSNNTANINPVGVTIDQAGFVYYYDSNTNKIWRVYMGGTPGQVAGAAVQIAGNTTTHGSGCGSGNPNSINLGLPGTMFTDAMQNVYYADTATATPQICKLNIAIGNSSGGLIPNNSRSYSFGNVALGLTAYGSMTLFNNGSIKTSLGNPTMTPSGSPFSVVSGTGLCTGDGTSGVTSLNAGDSCTLKIQLVAPTQSTTYSSGYNLSLADGAFDAPQVLGLSATVEAESKLAITSYPSGGYTIGTSPTPTVIVQIQDSTGNKINSSDPITLTLSSCSQTSGSSCIGTWTQRYSATQSASSGQTTFNITDTSSAFGWQGSAAYLYEIQATSGSLTPAPVMEFDVYGTSGGGGTATFSISNVSPNPVNAGSPFSFTVTSSNTSYTGTVNVNLSNGSWGPSFPAGYTFTGSENGIHNFTNMVITGFNSNPVTITASDNQGSQSGSAQITVNALAFQQLCVAPSSWVATVGSPLTVTVKAGDSYCNPTTGYTGSVYITSDDPYAVILPSSTTLTNGQQQVQVTFGTPGVHTITVADKAAPPYSYWANSGQIAVETSGQGSLPQTTTTLTVCTTNCTAPSQSATVTSANTIVTMQATVKQGGQAVTSGTVTFWKGPGQPLGTVQVVGSNPAPGFSTGTATLKMVLPTRANYLYFIDATYSGTKTIGPSVSNSVSVSMNVPGSVPTTTTLPQPQQGQDSYSFQPNVTGVGTQPLSGIVSLNDVTGIPNPGLNSGSTINSQPISWGGAIFTSRTGVPVGSTASGTIKPLRLVSADFNGDGIMDVAVIDDNSGQVVVLLGNGNGTFTQSGTYPAGPGPKFILAGDLNGDGLPDLVVVNSNAGTVNVLLNNPSSPGQFSAPVSYPVGNYPILPALADVNGDGILDLVVPNYNDGTISVLIGNGDGTFQTQKTFPANGAPEIVRVAGTNATGAPYLAVANEYSGVTIMTGDGSGNFSPTNFYPIGGNTDLQDMAVADFNGDGLPDIAVANGPDNSIYLLLADPQNRGNFIAQEQIFQVSPSNMSYDLFGLLTADFNNDGMPDLVAQQWGSGAVSLLINQAQSNAKSVTFNLAGTYPVGSSGRNSIGYVAADFNGDGVLDLVVTNYNDNTIGILPGATQGSVSFPSVFLPTGTHNIQANFTPSSQGSIYGSSYSQPVSIGVPAGYLQVSAASPVNSGSQFSFTVTAMSWSSSTPQINTGYNGTVTFSSSQPGANLPGQYTFVASDNGQRTFYANLNTSTVLTATDAANSLTGSVSITVNPNYLNINVPNSVTVGQPFGVTVVAQNGSGNAAAGYNGTIHFTSDDEFAVLPANSALNGGAGTFYVTFNTAGVHTLTATDVSNTSIHGTGGPIAAQGTFASGSGPSTTSLTVCANGASPSTCVTPSYSSQSPNFTVNANTLVTLTATVTQNNGQPATSGTVTFWNGSNPLGTAQVVANTAAALTLGTATLKMAFPLQNYSEWILATFNGTASVPPSVAAGLQLSVNAPASPIPTTTTLSSNPNSGNPQNFDFQATVNGATGNLPLNGQVALSDITSGTPGTFLGNQSAWGNTGFGPRVAASLGAGVKPMHLVSADFNGDGIMDVAFIDSASNQVVVLLGNGDGTFNIQGAWKYQVPSGRPSPRFLVAGDLNGDGLPDLVIVNSGNFGDSTPGAVTVLLNNPSQPGSFSEAPGSPYTVGYFPLVPTLVDVNGDGILDLVVPNYSSYAGDWQNPSSISVLIGDGTGKFTPSSIPNCAQSPLPKNCVGPAPEIVRAVGFNSSGAPYLAVANEYTGVTIMSGDGTGGFTQVQSYPVASNTDLQDMVVADFNGDGHPDIAVANGPDNSVYILLATSTAGQFQVQSQNYPIPFTNTNDQCSGYGICGLLTADFNNDGMPDLVVQKWGDGAVTLLMNQSQWTNPAQPGLFNVAGTYSVGSPGRNSIGINGAFDFNGDGTLDVVVTNSTDGTIGILPGITQQSVYFQNVSLPSGSRTIQAAFTPSQGSSFAGSSQSITVTAGQTQISSSTLISANPTTFMWGTGTGASSQLTATVTGTGTAAPTGSVTFSYGTTTLGTSPLTPGASNSSTASLSVNGNQFPAGNTWITATYQGDVNYFGSSGATQVTVLLSNPYFGESMSLAYTSGTPGTFYATPGQTFSMMVTAMNADGSTNTGYTGTANLSGPAGLFNPASYTFQASEHGTHTFNNLSVATPGNYQITVTDSQNSSMTGGVNLEISSTALSIQTPVSLPTAYVGQSYSGSINAQNGVPGYSWSLAPSSGGLPPGLSFSNLNGSSLQITGTPQASDAGNTYPFAVQVSDSATPNHNVVQLWTSITVNGTPPPLIVSGISRINDGGVGLPYSSCLTATGGSGNYANYHFSAVNGSLPAGLAFNGSCIVGKPTTVGSSTFQVQVTDSTTSQTTTSVNCTIVISAAPNGSNNQLLYGHYAFLYRGFVDNTSGGGASYQSASVGSFSADGQGHISGGGFFVNDGSGKASNSTPFTGTYSIGADNRGVITLNTCVTSVSCYNSSYAGQTFVFSAGEIENVSLSSGTCPTGGSSNNSACPVYTDARMIEFDDAGNTPSGVHGQAHLLRQNYGQFNSLSNFQANVPGNWVFSFEGEDTTQSPLGSVGVFTISAGSSGTTVTGNIPSGTADINDNGSLSSLLSLNGSDTYTSTGGTVSNGMFTGTLTASGAPSGYPTNFTFFMVNSNRLIGLSWNTHNTNSLVSGTLYKQQQSSYSAASMPGAAVMYMTGGNSSSSWADLLQLTCGNGTSGETCTINAHDSNSGGTYTSGANTDPPPGTVVPVSVATNGRVAITNGPIFYLYDSSATGGGVVLSPGGVEVGQLYAQGTVPGGVGALATSYYMGSLFNLNQNTSAKSNVFTTDSSGNMNGFTQDSSGQQSTNYGSTVSGATFAGLNSYGVFNLQAGGTAQSVCYLVQPVCSGTGNACGGSGQPPFGQAACADITSSNPRISMAQQVQTNQVTVGPATHFLVSAPSTATTGTSFTFTVTALDANNYTVTGYSGNVNFTSSDPMAAFPNNYVTLSSGTGTFSAKLNTTGSQTITATDSVTTSITGTSNSITVSAPVQVATHFAVSAPSTATAGTSFQFTVTALDASNNTVTGYSGTVHLTSSDPSAYFPYNPATVGGGTGMFTVTMNTAGSQTITATDTVNSITGTSNSITVSSAPTGVGLTITATPYIPNGLAGNSYELQLSASGGTQPYSFSLASGSSLPSGLQLNSTSGVISGTLPTTAGNVSFTVQATDSSTPQLSGTLPVTIPVSAVPNGSKNSAFKGSYLLNFFGFNDADGTRIYVAGSLAADGNGNITSGVLDVMGETGSFTSSGTVTGTYSIGSDLRGIVRLNLATANFTPMYAANGALVPAIPSTFAVALSNVTANMATRARLVAFDDPASNVHGQGLMRQQSLAGLTSGSVTGTSYVFASSGRDPNGNTLYWGGVFGLGSSGNIVNVGGSPSTVDMATHYSTGQVNAPISATLSGSYTFAPSTGRLLLTLTPSTSDSNVSFPTHYVAYLQKVGSGAYDFLMPIDSSANGFPLTSADLYPQAFPTSGPTMQGNYAFFEKGATYASSTTYFSEIGQVGCTATPSTCTLNEGFVSTGSTLQSVNGTFSNINVGANGRVTLTDADGSSAFLYLYGAYSSTGNSGPSAQFWEVSTASGKMGSGNINSQTLPTPAFSLPQSFAAGVTGPSQSMQFDTSGILTLSSASGVLGSLSGSVDHASKGFISYGDAFGPWALQTADQYGVSQAKDGSGNLLGACAISSNTSMFCLANSPDPNGQLPSTMVLNTVPLTLGGLQISPTNPTVLVNGTQQFTATASYSGDSATQNVTNSTTWASLNTAVATISSTGLATANAIGTATIQATYCENSVCKSPTTTLAVPGAATYFQVSGTPLSVTAGSQLQFTVTAKDINNNTAIAYTGTVFFTSSDRSAVFPSNNVTLTNGTGTFTATINATGPQTITATDSANNLSGTSGTIFVEASGTGLLPTTTTLTDNSASLPEVVNNITLTATVTGTGSVAPTGWVLFSNSYFSGTAHLSPVANSTSATATFNLQWDSHVGPQNVTATYSGDSVYQSSTSNTDSVTPPFARLDFGSVNVGQQSPVTQVYVPIYSAFTLGSWAVLSKGGLAGVNFLSAGGGTCGGSFSAGSTCYVNVTFAPQAPGYQPGAVVLYDTNGVQRAIRYLGGTGTSPLLALSPGTQSAMSINSPKGFWVDWNGNVYVADAGVGSSHRVLRIPAGAGWPPDPSTGTTVGTTVAPIDLTLDGAGNLYIVDAGTGSGNGQVVLVPNNNGTLNTAGQTVLLNSSTNNNLSGVNYGQPQAITVNSLGYLFVAYPQQVVVVPFSGGALNFPYQFVAAGSFTNIAAITLDTVGNLYVADQGAGKVYKVPSTNGNYNYGAQTTIGNFTSPTGVGVDAAYNVYVVDSGQVWMVPYENGAYNAADQITIGSGLLGPTRVQAGGRGNVYIADTAASQIVKVLRSQANFTFGSEPVGTPSAPLLGSMWNVGNSTLTFNSQMSSETGNSDSFNASPGAANPAPGGTTPGCTLTGGEQIVNGYGCNVQLTFQPTTTGSLSSTITLLSNSPGNLAPITVLQTGTGLGAQATITLGANPTSISPTGSTLLTATVTGSYGTMPTGTVNFYLGPNPTPIGQGTLFPATGFSTATLTVTAAQITASGYNQFTASYAGDSNYSPSALSSPVTVTVTAPTLIPTTTTLVSPSTFPIEGSSPTLTLTATVTGSGTGASPTGSVTFTDMTTGHTLGTVSPLTAVPASTQATASLQATVGGTVNGMNNITATYSGDTTYSGSTSLTASVDVIYPRPGFGSITVGQQSSVQSVWMGVTSTQAVTLSSATPYAVLTYGDGAPNQEFLDAGGSTTPCSAGLILNPGNRCLVNVYFAPKRVGSRAGAVVLYDSNNNVAAIRFLGGTGNGPLLAFDQGVQNILGPLSNPHGFTTDMVSMFVADTGSKRVLQLPNLTGGGYNAANPTVVLSGLINPVDVSIDGAGNIYVVDAGSGNNDGSVIMVPKKSDGTLNSANPVVLLSATVNNNLAGVPYGQPQAISVFTGGNIFVAYPNQIVQVFNANGVLQFAAPASGTACPTTGEFVGQCVVDSGYTNLSSITGDPNSNLYVADAGNPNATPANYGQVVKIPALSGVGCYNSSTDTTGCAFNTAGKITLGSGFNQPNGVSIDMAGNIYVADTGNARVVMIPNESGTLNPADQITYGTGLTSPVRVSPFKSGPVYIADAGANQIVWIDRSTASFSFAPQVVGVAGPSQTLTLRNVGSQQLTFNSLASMATGNCNSFVWGGNTSQNACNFTPLPSLASGATYSTTFQSMPAQIGALSATDTLSLTSPANLDLKTVTIQLTGTGIQAATGVITWAAPTSITYGTALSSTQLNATAADVNGNPLTGTFVYTPPAGTVLTAGTQTLSVAFTSTDGTTTAAGSVTITVLKASPQVTWATPADITYGTALGSTQLNATASVPGTFVYSPPAGTVLPAVFQGLTVTFTPTDTADYTTTIATVQINVNKATPTITWATPADITFGTPLSSTQLNATASVPGTFAYLPPSGTVLAAGSQTLSVTFTPTDMGNYAVAKASVTLQVNSGTGTVTWPTPTPITYGTALTTTQLNAQVTYNGVPTSGTYVYTPPVGTLLNAGSQTLSVTFTPNNSSYGPTTSTVTLQVNPATPRITWAAPASITYGAALSSAQLNATASVPGTFVYSPPAGTVLSAGTQTLSVTFTPTDSTDYTTANSSVTLQVNPVATTVTWATPASITYGTALSSAQLNATASMPGTFVYSPPAGTILSAGTPQLSVTFTPTDTNYGQATANVTIRVNKATPTITWSAPSPISYGMALSGTQLNATTPVPGTFAYTPAAGTVLTAGTYTLLANFTPTDTTNYNSPTATVPLTVNKAVPTITWPTPAPITYGTAIGSTQLNATASVPGTFAYLPPSGTMLAAGSQTLSVTFTPTDMTDYAVANASVTLVVNSGGATVTWPTPAPITYGTALGSSQLDAKVTYNGVATSGTYVYTPPLGTILSAGSQTLSVTFTPANTTSYTPVTSTVTLQVNQAVPRITWTKPAAINYGTALDTTQLNATASVPGTFVYTPAAGTVLTGGTQTLSATFTPTDTVDYTSPTVTTTITVNKVVPTITWATPAGISYGTALGSTQLNATASVPGTFAYSPAAGAVLAVGTQTLSVTFTPTDTTDYATAKSSVQLQVSASTPIITWATPAAINYGTALGSTQLNAKVTFPSTTAPGTFVTVAGTYVYTPAAGTVLPVGSQTLSVNFTPTSGDYSPVSTTVTLTVNQATPQITWAKPASIAYGTALDATQLNAASAVPGTFVYTPPAGTVLSAGTQTLSVTFTPTDLLDYVPTTVTNTIVVTKATPTITWAAPANIDYLTPLSSAQLNATASVPGTFAYSPAAGRVLAAGPQTLSVTFTPTDTTDYATAKASVTLTVNQITPIITWNQPSPINYGTKLSATQLNATITYNGAAVPASSFAYTVNGVTPALGALLSPGNYTLVISPTAAAAANFTSPPPTASVSLTVNQAKPTITWVKPAAIVYGTALDSTQLNATASVPGTFVYTPPAGTVLSGGTQTLSVTFTPTDTTDYTTATVTTTITVSKVVPTVTWATPAAISYGTALDSTQLNATASVPGTFVYSPAAGSVQGGGARTLSVTFTPTDTTDYGTVKASVQLQVNPSTPTITWTPTPLSSGAALTTSQLNAKATFNGAAVSGTYVYTPAAGTVATPGQTLSVTFTPASAVAANFTTATASVTLQGAPTITWAKPAAITYGTPLSNTQLDATASVPGTFVYTPGLGTVLGVGTQTLSVTFTPADTTDYSAKTATTTITVSKAPTTTSITAGTPNPSSTGQAVSFAFTVTSAAGVSTGNVTVTATTGETCSGALTAGTGSCSLTFTTTGPRSVKAVYGSDSSFAASSSSYVSQGVQ